MVTVLFHKACASVNRLLTGKDQDCVVDRGGNGNAAKNDFHLSHICHRASPLGVTTCHINVQWSNGPRAIQSPRSPPGIVDTLLFLVT